MVKFEVASKEAGLGLEEKNVQPLVYVSGGASRGYAGSVEAEVLQSVQQYKYGKGSEGGAHTTLPLRTLPAGGFEDACSGVLSSLLIASRETPSRRALGRGRSPSMPRGLFPVKGRIG